MLLNGTNQYAIGALTTAFVGSGAMTLAVTFKTGAVVTGVTQYPVHVNRASSFLRGWGIEISTTGQIRGWGGNGSLGYTASLGIAAANTVYTAVLTKDAAGVINFYLNTLGNTGTVTKADGSSMTRVIIGALFDNAFSGYFGGKVVRAAFYTSVVSNADITKLLSAADNPATTTAVPQDYWLAVSSDAATIGSNALVRTGATYDGDDLISLSLTSVNGGSLNNVTVNASMTYITSGFSAAPDTGTIDGVALLAVTATGANMPDLVDNVVTPRPGVRDLTITKSAQSVTRNDITVNVKAGLATSPALVAPINNSNTGIVYNFSPAAAVGDYIYYPPIPAVGKTTSVDANANLTTDYEGTQVFWHVQNSTKIARSYNVVTGPGGVVISVSRARAVTGRTPTGRTPTATVVIPVKIA